ncbi:MAG TPA: hypothetical protein VHN18_00105 [Micromonosporaceae bacterium]|nr:hypothetical protein [Micromonosporaceae bacterium]
MEPGQPPTYRDAVPAQRTPPGGGPGPAPGGQGAPTDDGDRRRRLRPVLAVLGGVLALLCLGGLAAAYLVYDDATGPDRSAPDVVVDNYLRAYLVDRDDARADQYVCRGAPDLAEVRALRDDIQAREQRYSVRIVVSWGSLRVEPAGEGRAVTTEVRRTIADGSERAQDRWRFEVVDRDGWRVCSARRLS